MSNVWRPSFAEPAPFEPEPVLTPDVIADAISQTRSLRISRWAARARCRP